MKMPLWAFWEQPLRWPAPHFTCATNNPDYIFLWHSKPAPDDHWASSKWFGWQIIKTIFTPPPLLLQHHYILRGGGCWSKFRGIFFLMNFELLTSPCREMIKLSIHIWHDSKINPFLYIKSIFWCDTCIVYIDITKLQMRFLHYAFLS